MSVEENKVLVRRRFEEIDNQQNVAAVDELFAANSQHHDPHGGFTRW